MNSQVEVLHSETNCFLFFLNERTYGGDKLCENTQDQR